RARPSVPPALRVRETAGRGLPALPSAQKHERGEDVIRNNAASPRLINIAFRTTRSTYQLVFLAFFFLLFVFVVFAQHFAVRIHFDANLLAVLVDDGFKVGALLLPADNRSAFGFCLGSLLHRGRHIRTADALFFAFSLLGLSSDAKCQAGAYRCYCE